ncbi:MAG: relaxase [Burkholderiales bacterium RIFCSPLOWO2_12_FULL_64_99]|nr:MAG: relaxase [Burkholderiales bacterium RIFCSPHIGHO2_12_FULL_63_20]OGB61040.1 MAG: relaxase [Burkholderiales bacterium RIFCSPLOWO2_12_FULL_64_99]
MPAQPHASSPYASVDPGFSALSANELLAEQDALIARIKLCHGSDSADFEHSVLTLIRRYARFVHLLPATADNYFCTPGGLLRLGMEVGFFSLQGTDAHIFSGRSTITARRHLEPRWRLATFIAGLCCEAHRVLSHTIVTDGPGEVWPAYLTPLSDWLTTRQADRYFLRWRPQAIETRSLGVFALAQIVPTEVMHYLAEGNALIVPHMMASVSGIAHYRDHNVLDELVRRSLALVIDRNLVTNADRYGSPQYGSHLERYLIDALRHLASVNPGWQVNREKSRVWFGPEGLFLVWPQAAEDIQALLDAQQLSGIPKAPSTIMEVLLSAGVLEPKLPGQTIFLIQPPGSKVKLEAVKLSAAAIMFDGLGPPPPALTTSLIEQTTLSPSTSKTPTAKPDSAAPSSPMPSPSADTAQGVQLPLLQEDESNSLRALAGELSTQSRDERPQPPAERPDHPFTLQAPLRLNPVVRDALSAVVHSLNAQAGPPQCCTVARGVFVPLNEFERRGIQPSLALRALSEVRMLVRPDAKAAPTTTREFNGTTTAGLTIDPRFISGLDLEAFALAAASGE